MRKKNVKKSKKVLFIIVLIVVICLLGIGYYFYDYYERLDGRECMDCPYIYDLTVADVDILNKDIEGYNATVEIGNHHDSLKINGKVYLGYDCEINYCFQGSGCYWNYTSNGIITYDFNNDTSHVRTFSVKPYYEPTSIYMYLNSVKCNFTIEEANGDFKIYGERVR